MKRMHFHTALALSIAMLFSVPSLAVDLDSFLAGIDVTAQADLGRFRADLRASFEVSSGEVDELFDICDSPADVYMTLRIGQVAKVPIERVLTEYRADKARGWGAIAKSVGIKPGSPEFHALKQGRLVGHLESDASDKEPKGHGPGNKKGGK